MDFSGQHASVVYFIRDTADGQIKIGYTTNLRSRLSMIRCTESSGNVEIMGYVLGGFALEQEIHEMFDASRQRGEWFDPSPDLLSFISSTTLPYEKPPLRTLYRTVGKKTLAVQLPPALVTAVKLYAIDNWQSYSEGVAELLCRALGIDPTVYGIEPLEEEQFEFEIEPHMISTA